jgi:nickel-type superoxide dismutase maturation protease
LRRRRRFRVTGASMSPLLEPGDEVLVDMRAYKTRSPQGGDLVLLRHPYRPQLLLVKRVSRVEPDGRLRVAGDNPAESSDSRAFGALLPEQIVGQVTSRFP